MRIQKRLVLFSYRLGEQTLTNKQFLVEPVREIVGGKLVTDFAGGGNSLIKRFAGK